MKTDQLKINQLSDPTYAWYLSYLEAIDTKNLENKGLVTSVRLYSDTTPLFA